MSKKYPNLICSIHIFHITILLCRFISVITHWLGTIIIIVDLFLILWGLFLVLLYYNQLLWLFLWMDFIHKLDEIFYFTLFHHFNKNYYINMDEFRFNFFMLSNIFLWVGQWVEQNALWSGSQLSIEGGSKQMNLCTWPLTKGWIFLEIFCAANITLML